MGYWEDVKKRLKKQAEEKPRLVDGPWKKNVYAEDGKVSHVPIPILMNMRGNNYRFDTSEKSKTEPKGVSLQDSIKTQGLREPGIVQFDPKSGRIVLGEGNHRVHALAALGYTHAPVRAVRGWVPEDEGIPHPTAHLANEHGYIPADMSPHKLGIPGAIFHDPKSEIDNSTKM
jgi:hypothetical protein